MAIEWALFITLLLACGILFGIDWLEERPYQRADLNVWGKRGLIACALLIGPVALFLHAYKNQPLKLAISVAYVFLFSMIAETDRAKNRIFLLPVGALAGVAIVQRIFMGGYSFASILGGVALGGGFFGVQYLLSKGRMMGEGDIYLGAAMGVMFGFPLVLFAILLSYIVGSMIVLTLLATKQITRERRLPLGSFLALGGVLTLLIEYYSPISLRWYGGG